MSIIRSAYFTTLAGGIAALSLGCSPSPSDTPAPQVPPTATSESDESSWERAWLDSSYSDRALAWVNEHNAATLQRFDEDPRFLTYQQEAAVILSDPQRLPGAQIIGGTAYDYWQDAEHVLGVWRATAADALLAGRPEWSTVIDLDALAAAEGRKWIFAGADCREQRCLISLADNGKDAHEVREFDLGGGRFVEEEGFFVPEDKSSARWYDADTLLVGSSAGAGKTTESDLPSTLRLWKRGTELRDAPVVFEIDERDASVSAVLIRAGGVDGFIAIRRPDFFTSEFFYVEPGGQQQALPLPQRVAISGVHDGQLLLRLNQDWTPTDSEGDFRSGDLVAVSLQQLMQQQRVAEARLLYRPSGQEAVRTVMSANDVVFAEVLRDYRSAIVALSADSDGNWTAKTLEVANDKFISLLNIHDGKLVLRVEGLLQPEKIVLFDPEGTSQETLYARPSAFDSDTLVAELKETSSRDGTKISYSIIHDVSMALDGTNPTLIYGYGGFDVSITPRYEPLFGKLWLEKGGVYVHAYLRGGGENGPDWHQSAMLKNRQLPYDDMIAVVEDLQRNKVTDAAHTGIMGRSNGGLMVAAVMTQRPELLNAVVVGGPLIDMLTYQLIPPGATWTAEYGDPRNEDMRDFIASYSPLQQLKADRDYPAPLIITSTDDDRVLPGHARRFAAKLEELGYDNYYFEDEQGGHYWELAGGPAPGDWRARSRARAVEFTYLAQRLMDKQ